MPRWESHEENFAWLIGSMVDDWNGQMQALGEDSPQYDVTTDKGGYTVKLLSKAEIRKRRIAAEKEAAEEAQRLELERLAEEEDEESEPIPDADMPIEDVIVFGMDDVDTEDLTFTDVDESALGDDAPVDVG